MSAHDDTHDDTTVREGRRILEEEAEAIRNAGRKLGESFVRVVERILRVEGHVAVTGVGKSGIIGEKIAATLASTGSPAFFLKPVEALHGDLGMVSDKDLLVAISASGETSEVLAVVEAAKALGVEVVALTGATGSSLARQSILTLDVGVEREVCPLGLAPTASTTVTLAVGDALAMVLLEKRGFTREHYLRFHPGGSLGERLRFCVRDLMRRGDQIPCVRQDALLCEALEEMTRRDNLGLTLVVSAAGKLTGIVTDGDLRRILLGSSPKEAAASSPPGGDGATDVVHQEVSRLMTRNPRTVEADSSAAEALRTMEVHGITSLAVINHRGEPEGVVHLHDILGRGKFSI